MGRDAFGGVLVVQQGEARLLSARNTRRQHPCLHRQPDGTASRQRLCAVAGVYGESRGGQPRCLQQPLLLAIDL